MFIRDQVTWVFSLDESDLFWQMYGATDMLCVFLYKCKPLKVSSSHFLVTFYVAKNETELYLYLEIVVESFF